MGDPKESVGEEIYEPDPAYLLAVSQADEYLAHHDGMKKLGMDDDIVKAMLKSCGPALEVYRAMRKALCELLGLPEITKLTIGKMREMDVQLALPADDGSVRKGPYGYLTLGSPEFVYARRAVLASLTDALLVVLNKDRHAQGLGPVNALDYTYYGTSASDFETAVFTLLSYAMYPGGDALLGGARQEVKDLRDLVNKERRREQGLAQKGISNSTLVKLRDSLYVKTKYLLVYGQFANSVGSGHIYHSVKEGQFPIDARAAPEYLNPLGDTRNSILGKRSI